MTTITVEKLERRLAADDDIHVVDIRSEDEYADATIDGSRNLPRDDLIADNLDAVQEQLHTLPDQELVLICDAGVASHETAKLLSERGWNAKALEGGFRRWSATRG